MEELDFDYTCSQVNFHNSCSVYKRITASVEQCIYTKINFIHQTFADLFAALTTLILVV